MLRERNNRQVTEFACESQILYKYIRLFTYICIYVYKISDVVQLCVSSIVLQQQTFIFNYSTFLAANINEGNIIHFTTLFLCLSNLCRYKCIEYFWNSIIYLSNFFFFCLLILYFCRITSILAPNIVSVVRNHWRFISEASKKALEVPTFNIILLCVPVYAERS